MIAAAATSYLEAGLSVLPACAREKRPTVPRWKPYQQRLPTATEITGWFRDAAAMCVVTGAVSRNLEMLDFDLAGDRYEPWVATVQERAPALLERLVIERSQSGGRHVVYRCAAPVSGNLKLAQRAIDAPDGQPVTIQGKSYRPRRHVGRWIVIVGLIETRGEGGLFLCAPTPGYELVHGDFTALPVLSEEERITLLDAAWSLNEWIEPVDGPKARTNGEQRPGDDFNARGDIREILVRNGWSLVRAGENEYWRRPGKEGGWSATLKHGVFYVFTSNAEPFEPNRAYSPFATRALLEHGGDFNAAASALQRIGFGSPDSTPARADDSPAAEPERPDDPGPMPEQLLEVPGFIRQVMDYTLATAHYPQPALAFAGALILLAFLAGRRVRDASDTRTNLYVLALANSGAGKDHPRKVNQHVLLAAGLQDAIGDRFASGEGIEDRLFTQPAMLFQTDEIDGVIASINKAMDARHESILNTLLKMYTSANALYPMRAKAGKQSPGVIDQPCLCVLGTAVPRYYYEALSVRMLNNGFFARLLILEADKRGTGQDPVVREVPESIVATATWWARLTPGGAAGNLERWHPKPNIVPHTDAAADAFRELREQADAKYADAEARDDSAAMAIWARAYEKVRKLALIHAVSTNHVAPRIDAPAVRWAGQFVEYQTRRMLYMAALHVSEGEFDAKCKRMLEVLGLWRTRLGDAWMPYWELSRRLKWSDRDIDEVRDALLGQERIDYEFGSTPRGGRSGMRYRVRAPREDAT